jgi:hypothetical protein
VFWHVRNEVVEYGVLAEQRMSPQFADAGLNAHRNGPTFAHENGPSLCAGLYGAELVTSSSARVTRTLQPLPDGDAAPGPTAPPIEEQPVQMGLPIAAEPSAARWGGRYSRADR